MSKQNRDLARRERAAAVRAEQERKERNRRIGLTAALLIALGAIVAAVAWYGTGSTGNDVAGATRAQVRAVDGAVVVGPDTAATKVVLYEDFQCPYCRQLEDQTRDFLRENAEVGKVQVTYHPVNLLSDLPYSERAMNAFAAVLQHGSARDALKLHDLLYENQPYETDSASMSNDDIAALVAKAGATGTAVTGALADRDQAFFDAASTVMSARGITGTPTVVLNGTTLTGASVPELVKKIEDAVG